MQPDYMGMAQQAQAQPQQGQMDPQQMLQQTAANIKQFLVETKLVKANELDKEIMELAQLMIDGDEALIKENKLYQTIEAAVKALEEDEARIEKEQGAQQQGPTDFAGMMPQGGGGMMPPGGGMNG